jgi:hypothetical protein
MSIIVPRPMVFGLYQRLFICLLSVFSLTLWPLCASALTQHRYALVIGNSAYDYAPLSNPVNDATDVALELENTGFEVMRVLNADLASMKNSIRQFTEKLKQEHSVGLFFFAGHGIEVDGANYLMPINAKVEEESDLRYEAIHAGRLLDGMNNAGNGLNLIILDACRNNPFSRSFRSVTPGLAEMHPVAGTLVLYATEPRKVAQDGKGRNGTFTKSLLAVMKKAGLSIEQLFKKVAIEVSKETEGAQVPWFEGVILGDFYLLPDASQESMGDIAASTGSLPVSSPVVSNSLPPAASGALRISVNVDAADVAVNGRYAGRVNQSDPLLLKELADGEVELKVDAAGYYPQTKTVRIISGQWAEAEFTLHQKNSAPPQPSIALSLRDSTLSSPSEQSLPVVSTKTPRDETSLKIMADGISDQNYYMDPQLAHQHAVEDARRQVIKKALNAYIPPQSHRGLTDGGYEQILNRGNLFIRHSDERVDYSAQQAGLYHVWLQAELNSRALLEALKELAITTQPANSRNKATIALDFKVNSGQQVESCDICEIEVGDRLAQAGYQIIDGDNAMIQPVLKINGTVRLRTSPSVMLAGVTTNSLLLTNWAVRVIEASTGKVVFSKNIRPTGRGFNNSEEAILFVGRQIGKILAKQLLYQRISSPLSQMSLHVSGLREPLWIDTFRHDLLSTPLVTDVTFSAGDHAGSIHFDIQYSGQAALFQHYLQSVFLDAINKKYGAGTFNMVAMADNAMGFTVLRPENLNSSQTSNVLPLGVYLMSESQLPKVIKNNETLMYIRSKRQL